MQEETIELRQLLAILLDRKWLITIITLVCILAGTVYSLYMVTPMYRSYTTLMVNGSKGSNVADIAASFDLGSINLSQKLVVTYGEIVKSKIVLEQVIQRLDLDMDYDQLLKNITSQPVGSTEILKISVIDENPERAALIANNTADVFMKEVIRILKVNNVETIDAATPKFSPFNVKTILNIAISLILGLMLGGFIAFGLAYMDQTIKTQQDVEKYLGASVIGMIPNFANVIKD